MELEGLRHATVSCPSTSRGVAQADCGLLSVEEYRFVASPASYSTVRERLNLPVWSWRDCGMLCFLPKHCARGGTRRLCPCERGSVHVCSVTCILQHCARGIAPASVELAGLWHATVSCPSNARGVAHIECGPASVGVYCAAFCKAWDLEASVASVEHRRSEERQRSVSRTRSASRRVWPHC